MSTYRVSTTGVEQDECGGQGVALGHYVFAAFWRKPGNDGTILASFDTEAARRQSRPLRRGAACSLAHWPTRRTFW